MARRQRRQLHPAELTVAETMGRLAEVWGLRKNLGRVWAVLFLMGRPMTAAELQHGLKLSTGTVSMTLSELQRWGVIRRVWRSGERRKLYVAEVDVWRVLSRMLRARELVELERAVDKLEQATEELRRDVEKSHTEEERHELERHAKRTAGLLDLLRTFSSLLRVLSTTARLDASVLSSFRLGGEDDEPV